MTLLLASIACKQPPSTKPAARVPQMRATVVTIRTTIQPDNKVYTHMLVIAGGRARSMDELDRWRLFDTKAKSVTFVDDIARTTRTGSLESLQKQHRDDTLPVRVTRPGEKKSLLGVNAELTLIEVGNYRRELWLAEHRAIPNDLFAMMMASGAAPDDSLTRVKTFPLLDHSELPVGDQKRIIDRAVISILQRNVPESLLRVPGGYRALEH